MRQSEVKLYNSENELYEASLDSIAVYPCSTPNLFYNAIESVYEPTSLGLAEYGVNTRRMTSENTQNLSAFCKKISRQLYEFIMNVDGSDIEKVRFMIAKSVSPNTSDKYMIRKTVEKALYAQAEYYIKVGDRQTYNSALDPSQNQVSNLNHFMSATHIAPAAYNYLVSVGFLYAANINIIGFNPKDKKGW